VKPWRRLCRRQRPAAGCVALYAVLDDLLDDGGLSINGVRRIA
jgi:uncharacterized protein YjiS (DUF1127 family)